MSKRTVIDRVVHDLKRREHLDAYVAIILGLTIGVLGILGQLSFQILAACILLTLSFSVFGSLANRWALGNLEDRLQSMQPHRQLIRMPSLQDRSIGNDILGAKDIALSGISLFRLLNLYTTEIRETLEQGAKIRIILLDPDGAAVKMASLRSSAGTPNEVAIQRIRDTVGLLERLKESVPEAAIEIRILDFLAAYSLMILKPRDSSKNVYCHARILPFRTPSLRAPIINPDPNDDQLWAQFIFDQFEKMWEVSKSLPLAQSAGREA